MSNSIKKKYNKNQNLLNYRYNITSQYGEDGIIEEIFNRILNLEKDFWCCEFGAWDGKLFSNTWNLLNNKHWHGVLIEGDKRKHPELVKTYLNND